MQQQERAALTPAGEGDLDGTGVLERAQVRLLSEGGALADEAFARSSGPLTGAEIDDLGNLLDRSLILN